MDGISITDVIAGSLDITEGNVAISSNSMTMSYNDNNNLTVSSDEVLFTLAISAQESGLLSEKMSITSAITKAEAYIGTDVDIVGVNLALRDDSSIHNIETNALLQPS